MHRQPRAQQDRTDLDGVAGQARQVEGDVGRIHVRHHQQVGRPVQARIRENTLAKLLIQRHLRRHLTLDLEIRAGFDDQLQRPLHLGGAAILVAAETRMRQQCHPRLDAEHAQAVRRQQRDFCDLLGGGVDVDMGVAHEIHAILGVQGAHRPNHLAARPHADYVHHAVQLLLVAADHARDQRIGITPMHH